VSHEQDGFHGKGRHPPFIHRGRPVEKVERRGVTGLPRLGNTRA
jgi:hypothetical protein